MMKVCHVTSVHPLSDGRIFEKECCSLAKAGYDVCLVGVGESEYKCGVKIIGLSSMRKGRLYRFLVLDKKIIKKALELDCDVYHLHDPELLKYVSAIKKAGGKVIFDSHEDVPRQIYSKYWIPSFIRGVISKVYEKREKTICQKTDCVVAATDKIRDIFRKFGIKSETIFNYPIIGNEVRKSQIDNNVLCFAGGLSQSNGIIELIEVVKAVDDTYLKLAGKFEPSVQEYFESNKNERMEYLGVLPRQEVDELYITSGIGVVADLPTGNNIEGLPIKLFEFMKFGLPIITSNFQIRAEMFKKYDCGKLIDPRDKDMYIQALRDLIDNPEYKVRCAENGIKAVYDEYNWENEEKKLIELYEEIK